MMFILTALLALSSYAAPMISMDVTADYREERRVDERRDRQPPSESSRSNNNERQSSSEDRGMSEPERAEEGRMVVPEEYR